MNLREVINFFYDEAMVLRSEKQYFKADAIESVGDMINNVFHGRSASEWIPVVNKSIQDNINYYYSLDQQDSFNRENLDGYNQSLEMLQLISEDFNVTF